MEIIVGKTVTAEDMQPRSNIGVSEQQKKTSGDTLSISEAGKIASSEKGSRLVNKDTTDGIVIQRKQVLLEGHGMVK